MFVEMINYTELIRPWMAQRLPFPSNYFVPGQMRSRAEELLTTMYGEVEIYEEWETVVFKKAQQCLTLLADRLGTNEFFFGKSPTSFDALVFSYLAPLIKIPFPKTNPLKQHIHSSPNLEAFVNRILQNYFPTIAKDEPTTPTTNDDDFPNKWRDMLIFGIVTSFLMTSYSISKGIIKLN